LLGTRTSAGIRLGGLSFEDMGTTR
jgi:hypothetical protein